MSGRSAYLCCEFHSDSSSLSVLNTEGPNDSIGELFQTTHLEYDLDTNQS